MKQTAHVAPGVGYVMGTLDQPDTLLFDRMQDGEAFPGEQRIRLPRRKQTVRGIPEWYQGINGKLTTRIEQIS